MKISTKVQYGLRAMAYLAQNAGDGRAVSIREISYKEKISADYLEKIFARLLKAKILAAKKGVSGGYIMARPPEMIKISEIFNAIENPATKVKCIDSQCSRQGDCLTRNLWSRMQAAVNDFLESMTLDDIIKKNF